MIQQPTVTLNNGVKMLMVGFGVFQIPDPDVCQKAVEEAIKASGVPREELFITTKAFIQHINYEGAKEAFEESLRKLDTDYIDLYLLHQPVGDTFGAWRALEELYNDNDRKIRAIGVSNFEDDQLANFAIFNDVIPAVNQIELHVFNQKDDSVAYQASKGVQVESWGAFAEGRFDIFNNPILKAIADKYGKTTAQVMLRW